MQFDYFIFFPIVTCLETWTNAPLSRLVTRKPQLRRVTCRKFVISDVVLMVLWKKCGTYLLARSWLSKWVYWWLCIWYMHLQNICSVIKVSIYCFSSLFQRIAATVNTQEQKRLLMDLDISMRSSACPHTVQFYGALFMEGDVWICMEVMDTSLDKFYAKVYKFGRKIPEQILGPITVAVIICFY